MSENAFWVMNRKPLIVAWAIGIFLLSGCAKFKFTEGKAKFTIPFDFPQKKTDAAKSEKQ